MTAEHWKVLETVLGVCVTIMGAINISERITNSKAFKVGLFIVILFAGFASCEHESINSENIKMDKMKDSISYYNDKREIVDSLTNNKREITDSLNNSFALQRSFIDGQLRQLGFKIDVVNSRVIKVNERVMPDSTFNKLTELTKHKVFVTD